MIYTRGKMNSNYDRKTNQTHKEDQIKRKFINSRIYLFIYLLTK